MNNQVQQEQFAMVEQLAKPGTEILSTLSPVRCHIMHMLIGMMGESVELLDYTSRENLIEELGDFRFYQYGLYGYFNLTTEKVLQFYRDTHGFAGTNTDLFVIASNEQKMSNSDGVFINLVKETASLLDLGKKWVIYNKPERFINVEVTEPTVNVSVLETLAKIEILIGAAQFELNITDNQVLEANQTKLLKGENARYKSGSYSDQQADERADKQGESAE